MNFLLAALRQIRRHQGFTLFEMLVVLALLGISSAFFVPSFFGFMENYQLGIAQDQVHQGLQQAQSKALQTSTSWRFGIREHNSSVEWTVYPDGETPTYWRTLSDSLRIDDETSLRLSSQGIYSAKFDYKGNARILGRVTLTGRYSAAKKCVIVSTLLGATRKGWTHAKPNSSGKYCY